MKKIGIIFGSLIAIFLLGASIFAQPQIRLDPFFSTGLTSPLFMVEPPGGARVSGGRYFIVQQGGTIMYANQRQVPTVFLNITSRVLSGGERGLLGMALHPQYNVNRRFFVYYTRQPDGAIQIAEYQTSATNPTVADTTEKIIITIPHTLASNHNGGTVEFGPDGYLYAGPGDGGSGNDPQNNAQNINALLGKIIRLDINNVPVGQVPQYNIPPTNPYAGATAGADEIYAIGMRNPYRFSFDRGTGQLWVADVGQNTREEVDIVTLGGNYGWRIMEATVCNPNINGGSCTPPPGHIPPIFEYSITGARCAIIGGYVYRGSQGTFPVGSYIYGDYCTGEIILWNGSTQITLLDTTRNIVGFSEDRAGEIYVVGQSGTVEKIVTSVPFSGMRPDAQQ